MTNAASNLFSQELPEDIHSNIRDWHELQWASRSMHNAVQQPLSRQLNGSSCTAQEFTGLQRELNP
eukprot:3313260-Amphidinium_carterae.1